MSWWKRFTPNQATLPTALLATAICAACLLLIWTRTDNIDDDISRYGDALSQTLAHANAGLLLHTDRIQLALLASQVNRYDEVAGVVFYSASNEIVALSGSTDRGEHFTASATLDDTITGYVTVVVDSAVFAPAPRGWSWLLTLLVVGGTPFLTLGLLQLSARGNRSLPIVSVPEPVSATPRPSFCLTINLHNQLGLSRAERADAVADAMGMAQEVCAIHQGIAVAVPDRGVIILIDQNTATAGNAVCAVFLLSRLLEEFETDGSFRCYLDVVESPGAPAELQRLDLQQLAETADIDDLMTLAALARAQSVLLSEAVYAQLTELEKTWAQVFSHPLLQDLLQDLAEGVQTYSVTELPDQQSELVDNQARVILGFTQG